MKELFRIMKEGPANDVWMLAQAEELFQQTFAHPNELEGDLLPLTLAIRQHALVMCILLACRIYEPPKKNNRTLGLPLAYQHICKRAKELNPVNPDRIARACGHDPRPISPGMIGDGEWKKMTPGQIEQYWHDEREALSELIKEFGENCLENLPRPKSTTKDTLSVCLENVRKWRNKHVAHNEYIPEFNELLLDITKLARHAEAHVIQISDAFFGFEVKPYSGPHPTIGCDKAAMALGRLAGILSNYDLRYQDPLALTSSK